MKKKQVKFFFILLALGYSGCLYFFYLKYVPLVKPFQILLTPFLLGVFILTAISVDRGTLFFIFSFPLINSLPYFFGIFEHIPHAPTALVLFLFYFFGWIVHNISSKSDLYFNHPIFKPIILFSVMIFLSGIITFLRYANFFPFLADSIYEIITNVHGVTAGGAIMSSLFFALNYVSGFAFFFILLNTIKSIKYIRKVVIVLLISTALSLGVGFYQEFIDPGFGNTPLRVNQSIINSTFKDPLSFGAYLSAVIALVLSAVFAFKGVFRILSFLVFLSALFILPRTGSKSGFVGMAISLLFFLIFFSLMVFNRAKLRAISLKKIVVFSTLSLFVAAIIFSALFLSRESESFKRLTVLNYQQGGLRETIKVRYDQWLMAAYMLKDYPLTGVGIGAYIIELPNYWQIHKGSLREWTDSAENYFLQVGSELGLLSLFFSFWIFWKF